jgi:hypothetical protein
MGMKFFPDFFIIGAPRCGTTSLSRYLSEHPKICFSRPKEPHYFSTISPEFTLSDVQTQYLERFFPHCQAGCEAVGEGSVSYLYSPHAIDSILKLNPDAKFIAMLRNPVQMIHSFHYRMLFTMDEDVRDFSRAWALQEKRSRGEEIPKGCREPLLLQYAEVGKLGAQVERFFQKVSEKNRMVIVFDDFSADTAAIYRKALAFINVSDDGRRSFPPKMVSKSYRFSWLQRWLYRPPKPVMDLLEASKKKQGKTGGEKASGVMGLRKRLVRFNVIKRKPAPLDGRMREVLRETFASDIERLGRLVGRDLSHWR